MLAYCTYCSAKKTHSEELLPAIDLYKSERITAVFNLAKTECRRFLILSGKLGVIEPYQKIDYYDHLLKPSEVDGHAELVASQLKEKKISQLVFFMNSITHDKNIKPYADCIIKAAAKSQISIEFRDAPFSD
ncbi:MAG TPA: hypothetical protein DHU89_03560 [Flavobacteriales bacterium]|nr:hypothetical protein [Flavobacteriales bacterium]|tara:strand:- start:347 stop:742 length:396 start_codon:yes stop_codon:yes gene_type:complete